MPWNITKTAEESQADEPADPDTVAADGDEPVPDYETDYDQEDDEYIVTWSTKNGAIEANTRSKSPLFGVLFITGGVLLYALGAAVAVAAAAILIAAVGSFALTQIDDLRGKGDDDDLDDDYDSAEDVTEVDVEDGSVVDNDDEDAESDD